MSVRSAKFQDIPALVAVWADGHARSRYADTATLDRDEAKGYLMQAIQRHGHRNQGGSLVLVAETDGVIEGFVIGLLDAVYPAMKELRATDLLFICSERVAARDPRTMVQQIIAWAEDNPKVIEVLLGVTDAIGDWSRTAKLYERMGLTQCGGMFRRGLER